MVDDIDRAAIGEDGLFALVNAARLGGGWLFLTSRTLPAAMEIATADLRSRLAAATIVPLGRRTRRC